jgi:hypothetical protein
MQCKLHKKRSRNRPCYRGLIVPVITTPIRAGILSGEDRGQLLQLISSLITKLNETTPLSDPDVLAAAYIDEVSQYTRVQQLDNTFWGRTSASRVKGGPYVRKNKRQRVDLANTIVIEDHPVSTESLIHWLIHWINQLSMSNDPNTEDVAPYMKVG